MGGENVKNTILEKVLAFIAPHPCSGCGKVGAILCHDCKYDIISESFCGCILCGMPQITGICVNHESTIYRAFTVGSRIGALETLINRLKFEHTKAAAVPLADLLNSRLSLLPSDTLVVPIPTVRSHVRQRGYDQVELIARQFAKQRGLPFLQPLYRRKNQTQHTVGKQQRKTQASEAFGLTPLSIATENILLVDDVVTTGATLTAAANLFAAQGKRVWVATLAYQPLD